VRRDGHDGLRVLIVEDDEATGKLLAAMVAEAGYEAPRVVDTGSAALLAAEQADLILLDQVLPDTTGLELLSAFRALPDPPGIILVTANRDASLAATAIRAGVDDYLVKDESLHRLLPEVMERVRRLRALRAALAAAERDLVHAERRAAIGQLNVTLHHELNNPLMAASAELELVLAAGGLTPEQAQGLAAVRRSLERVQEILHRVGTLRHDQTTEYLDGIEMIDLSRRTRQTPVIQGEALLLVPDQNLARVVAMLLRHAGFATTRVADVRELTERSGAPGVTLVVVQGGYGIGTDPLAGFRAPASRSFTLVALSTDDGASARGLGADHVVPLPFDPGTFAGDILAARRS
jgi:DNA-binding response OmpR family regulator